MTELVRQHHQAVRTPNYLPPSPRPAPRNLVTPTLLDMESLKAMFWKPDPAAQVQDPPFGSTVGG
jgi:hypothetical protein